MRLCPAGCFSLVKDVLLGKRVPRKGKGKVEDGPMKIMDIFSLGHRDGDHDRDDRHRGDRNDRFRGDRDDWFRRCCWW